MLIYVFILIYVIILRGINYIFPKIFDKYFYPDRPIDVLTLLNFIGLFMIGYIYPNYLKYTLTMTLLVDFISHLLEIRKIYISGEHFVMYSVSGMLGAIIGHSVRTKSFI